MSLKKKLGLGAASAALGLSLIGGGTFAYFNDTATVNNQFAAGTLNLDVNKDGESSINFDLRNLKPGDTAKRYFILANDGSLSIKDVLAEITASDFVDGEGKMSDSNIGAFLSQFKVDFFRVQDPENQPVWNDRTNLIAGNVSLADLVSKNYTGITSGYVVENRLNLAPTGLPVGDADGIGIQITFVDSGNQNIYQGDSVKVKFNLEARQEAGVEVNKNGFIESNEK
ncbi:TasA family protein, partial [Neobacillus vireti]|uniref:TasA family protein n=1 Tax=Neobacillus vireti TaxID=220686 RepID=UPI002FFFC1E5